MTLCANCGAALKYPVILDGKSYGSDCAAYLLGTHPSQLIVRGGAVDREAMAARDAERTARHAAQLAEAAARKATLEAARIANRERYGWLVDTLGDGTGGFCDDLARQIIDGGLASLSTKQFAWAADLYAKTFGRRGSKKYEAALDSVYAASDDAQPVATSPVSTPEER